MVKKKNVLEEVGIAVIFKQLPKVILIFIQIMLIIRWILPLRYPIQTTLVIYGLRNKITKDFITLSKKESKSVTVVRF
jgi:hypothetical protein